jgi:hypothetical protein
MLRSLRRLLSRAYGVTEEEAQLKAYCHINEFREHGLVRLPQMIAFCQPITLWSPSIQWMENHGCPITGDKLLEYVKNGYVRVVGRENWLTDKKFRNERVKVWEGYAWSEYDDRLLTFYNEDLKKKPEERRVFSAPKEPGPEYATETMKNPNCPEVAAARELLASGVPAAWAERIRPDMSENEKIFEVLRHSHNHAWGRKQADSDLIVYPYTETSWLFMKAVGLPLQSETLQVEAEDRERLLIEGVNIMKALKTFPEVETLDEFLKKGYRQDLVKWLDKACRTYSPLRGQDANECMRRTLGEMIFHEGLLDKREGWEALIPQTVKGQMKTAIWGVSAIAFVYVGQFDPVAFGGLAIDGLWAGLSALEVAGKIPLSGERYAGPQAPFFAENGENATKSRIYQMMRKLGLPDPKIIRRE